MDNEVIPDSEDEMESLALPPTKISPFECISPPSDQIRDAPPAKFYPSTSISQFSSIPSVEPRVIDFLNDISYFTTTTTTTPAHPSSSSKDISPPSAFTSTSRPPAVTEVKKRPRPKPRYSKPLVETPDATNPLDTSISSFTNATLATDDVLGLPAPLVPEGLSNDHPSSNRSDVSRLKKASSGGRSSSSSALINVSSSEDESDKPRKTLQSIPLSNGKKARKIVISDDEGSEYNYDEDNASKSKPTKRKPKQTKKSRRSPSIKSDRAPPPPDSYVEEGKLNPDNVHAPPDDIHRETPQKPAAKPRPKSVSKKRALPPTEGEQDPLDILAVAPLPAKKRKTKRRETECEVVIKSREFIDEEDDEIDQGALAPPVPPTEPSGPPSAPPKPPRQQASPQHSSHRHSRSASPDPIPVTKKKRKAARMVSDDEDDGSAGSPARVRRRIVPIEENPQDIGQLAIYTNPSTSNIESGKLVSDREQHEESDYAEKEIKTKPRKKTKAKTKRKTKEADQVSIITSTMRDEGEDGEGERSGAPKPASAKVIKSKKKRKGDETLELLTPHEGSDPSPVAQAEHMRSKPSNENASTQLKSKSQSPVDEPPVASPGPKASPAVSKVIKPKPKVEPILSKPRESLTVRDILRLVPQTGGGLHRVGLSKREKLAPLHVRLRTPPPPPPRLPKPPKKRGKDQDEVDSEEEYEGLSEAQIARKREEKRKAAWYSP